MPAAQNQTPSWPSLYDPLIEFHDLEHHAPIQRHGHYLTHAGGMPSRPFSGRVTHHSETHRRIPFHLVLDADLPFTVFPNHRRRCLFQYHISVATRRQQEWDGLLVLLDKKPRIPTGTPIALDDPADALDIRAIARPVSS